jgi:hypothetical protein
MAPAVSPRPGVVLVDLSPLADQVATWRRWSGAIAAAYAASPLAKRRDAKARLVAVVNSHAFAPTLAQVATRYASLVVGVARDLLPSPSTRSALATCHASNAPGDLSAHSVPFTRRQTPT